MQLMKNSLMMVLASVSLLVLTPLAAPGSRPNEDKIRVLVVTGGHDFEAEPFFALFDSIPDVEFERTSYPDAAGLLKPELANDYDVIVFYDMWVPGITPAQQESFVALLERGIGVVALHHTLAAHQQWPEYAKIIGGKYHLNDRVVGGKSVPKSGFLHDQDIAVDPAAGDHPITRGLKRFEIHDEAYNHYEVDPQATVLLTTEHPASDTELAWVKTYRHSRVFYLQLGHDRRAYEDPNYRLLVSRGIRWAAGRITVPEDPAIELFNGRDLAGWKQEGGASWEVRDGLLIGKQGADNAPGDLLTEASFDDFELQVTFRVQWPANSGVWFRYQSSEQAYQADILEYKEPFALTGTLYCTGKMFLAVNEDPDLVKRDDWNAVLIRAVGNRQIVFLNGQKVADVRDGTSDHGRIGFQVHAGGQFEKMRVSVKNVSVRRI
jgi:type 1 glutamine amidotransferase